jgi:hypothetical protein
MRVRNIFGTVFLAVLGLAAGTTSAAAAQPPASPCGGDVSTSGSITGLVDPFVGGTGTISGTVTVNRLAASSGGGKTQDYAFYLVPRPVGSLAAGSQITYSGVNFLNSSNPLQPSLPPPANAGNLPGGSVAAYSGSTPSGYLEVGFSGASQPDTETVTVNFTVGIVSGLAAGTTTIDFDVYYVCKGTGGYSAVTTPTLGVSNVVLVVTSMSALRATVTGATLDFGEIGQTISGTSTASLPTDIWVASNGPYSVTMTSCNNYVLSYSACGTTTTPGINTVKYNVTLLGHQAGYVGGTLTAFPSAGVTCLAAGTSGVNLPISALTDEGGQGKTPSTAYSDTLSVTFTPLAVSFNAGAQSCP